MNLSMGSNSPRLGGPGELVKARIALNAADWHGFASEGVWVLRGGNQGVLRSVPFYARGVAWGDEVRLLQGMRCYPLVMLSRALGIPATGCFARRGAPSNRFAMCFSPCSISESLMRVSASITWLWMSPRVLSTKLIAS